MCFVYQVLGQRLPLNVRGEYDGVEKEKVCVSTNLKPLLAQYQGHEASRAQLSYKKFLMC